MTLAIVKEYDPKIAEVHRAASEKLLKQCEDYNQRDWDDRVKSPLREKLEEWVIDSVNHYGFTYLGKALDHWRRSSEQEDIEGIDAYHKNPFDEEGVELSAQQKW